MTNITSEQEICAVCDFEDTGLQRDKNTGLLICRQCKKSDVSSKKKISKPRRIENGDIE